MHRWAVSCHYSQPVHHSTSSCRYPWGSCGSVRSKTSAAHAPPTPCEPHHHHHNHHYSNHYHHHHHMSAGQKSTPTRMSHGGPAWRIAPPLDRWCSAGWLRVSGRTGELAANSASAPSGSNGTPTHRWQSWSYSQIIKDVQQPVQLCTPPPRVSNLSICSALTALFILRSVITVKNSKSFLFLVKTSRMNLVAVAQLAVALPAVGTGTGEARGGLRDGGLGAQRSVLVLTADEFCLWWCTLLHLPQPCCKACRHGDAAATDVHWNRCGVKCRWAERKRLQWWNTWKWVKMWLHSSYVVMWRVWYWISLFLSNHRYHFHYGS